MSGWRARGRGLEGEPRWEGRRPGEGAAGAGMGWWRDGLAAASGAGGDGAEAPRSRGRVDITGWSAATVRGRKGGGAGQSSSVIGLEGTRIRETCRHTSTHTHTSTRSLHWGPAQQERRWVNSPLSQPHGGVWRHRGKGLTAIESQHVRLSHMAVLCRRGRTDRGWKQGDHR